MQPLVPLRPQVVAVILAATLAVPTIARADTAITVDTVRDSGFVSATSPGVLLVSSAADPTLTITGTASAPSGAIRALVVGTTHGGNGYGGHVVLSGGADVVMSSLTPGYLGDYGGGYPVAVSSGTIYLGLNQSTTGSLTVTGAGTTFTRPNTIYVGAEGRGTLNVLAGGRVESVTAYVGGTNGSSVTVGGSGSTWTNSGALVAGRNGDTAFTVSGGGSVTTQSAKFGDLWQNGTLTVTGPGSAFNVGNLTLGEVGTTAQGWGAVTVADGATLTAGDIRMSVSLGNRITLAGGTLQTSGIDRFYPSQLQWTSGTLRLTGDTGRIVSGFDVPAGGTFIGSGSATTATVAAGGTITPGTSLAPLAFTTDLTNAGTIAFDLASPTAFRAVSVGNTFYAGGTLRVTLAGGFAPALGDTFDLMDFGRFVSAGYAFDLTAAPLAEGLSWDTSSFAATGAISVVPEPATVSLLALGALLATRRRRDR